MPKRVPQRSHNGSHITRRKGLYCYRRRLPGVVGGEICLSLRTRHYREAEHRAIILDTTFVDALARAKEAVTDQADLNSLLRAALQEFLVDDLRRRMERPAGTPVYGHWWLPGDAGTATNADLAAIRNARASLAHDLATNNLNEMEERAEELVREHGLPPHLVRPLAYGLIEAAIQGWETAERRTLGLDPLVFHSAPDAAPVTATVPGGSSPPPATTPVAPLASSLIDTFGAWGRDSTGWRGNAENQAKVSLRLFIETCGDKAIDAYSRADGDTFRETLRRLPVSYRKSAAERRQSLAEIIAKADAEKAPRLSDKTVKRHFWAVSRFFAFLTETGRLPRDADNPGRGFSFNTKGPVRQQRDMWQGAELVKLFASPIWTGCHEHRRTAPGPAVIRDALFWLPLLGLYHGNRLEEFAQLRRADVRREDGVWFLDISDDDGRRLKNAQSRRRVPLHPQLLRIGFLEHVAATTSEPDDAVFPDLRPGGKDRKLGYYFSKEFSAYRKTIGLQRRGLDYHSFRHGVTTKLYQADVAEALIDLLTGHDQGGGESRKRYLKGIPLPQLRAAIARVAWPELDLSGLYVREEGDESWPVEAKAPTVTPAIAADYRPTALHARYGRSQAATGLLVQPEAILPGNPQGDSSGSPGPL